jgi:alpha-galactosidase
MEAASVDEDQGAQWIIGMSGSPSAESRRSIHAGAARRPTPKIWTRAISLAFLLLAPMCAQGAGVEFDAASMIFRLRGGSVSYVLGVNTSGELQSIYWGPAIEDSDQFSQPKPVSRAFEITDTPQEFAGWGGGLQTEPSLKVTFPDGNRDLVLHYVSHSIAGDELTIHMRDISRAVDVDLRYGIDAETGILKRSAEITNNTTEPFTVVEAESGTWNLPPSRSYQLRYLAGRWGGEFQVQDNAVELGATTLESRRGMTGHQFSPWFAIAQNPQVNEEEGRVWFGALAWSGSWRITIEQDPLKQIRITGGYNPFDFSYLLNPHQTLSTPIFYGGFTEYGYGDASRLLHHYELAHVLPQSPAPRTRPVLYNSWEATGFNVDEAGQEKLADEAASIGVERFVMDDGWFGERKDDHSGLGDWYVNPQKFPHGLKGLIDHVHSLGMDFGLWVEPEMVNPDSNLYRKHPDWVINFPGRPRTESRNQLVLNLARPEVREYILGVLDDLLNKNDIAFLKWDANRNWAEPGWPEVKPDEEQGLYIEYVQGLYSIMAELRKRHPKLEIESCSGGGGRVDLGILRYVDEVWTSDNTDPFDRLFIQNGFTYAYAPGIMMAWVTDSPNWYNHRSTSLAYRFLSSMQGSLGIGANLNKWTPDDFALAKQMIASYKGIRETVQHGKLYRLIPPSADNELAATEYISPDTKSTVLFAALHSQQMQYPPATVFPLALDPKATYTLHAIYGKTSSGSPHQASGAYWMGRGINVELSGDFDAAAFEFHRD